MKRSLLLILISICCTVTVHSQNSRLVIYNADSARLDYARGKIQLLVYGPKFATDKCILAGTARYGFTFLQVAGCEVDDAFIKGIDAYNDEMKSLIALQYGKDWYDKYEKEVEACRH